MTSMRILPLQKLFSLMICLGMSAVLFAQPANDDCSSPTPIVLGANPSNCTPVPGDTRGTVDATTVAGPSVCSGSWFADDVWFEFTTGSATPPNGIVVEIMTDPSNNTDLGEAGMAVYEGNDCAATNAPIECYSDAPGRRTITIPPSCIAPNTPYLVRIWSAPEPTTNSGTFTVCAYGADAPEPTGDVVIWSENFNDGIGNWVTNGISDSTHTWLWDTEGVFFNAFGGTVNLNSFEGGCNGAMGFPAGWFQTGRTGDVGQIPPQPYPDMIGELISPPIDLTNEPCASIKYTESFRGLNGNGGATRFGPFIDYSIDGGTTWIGGFDPNTEPDYEVQLAYNGLERTFPLVGVGGQSDVRVRFTYAGDFYYWIIDDVKLIQREDNNMRANSNFYAIAPTTTMPINQLDDMGFLIDISNIGCDDQTNVNVNCQIVDNADGSVVFDENLAYGLITADSTAENQLFDARWSPTPGVATTYTGTYTVSSDQMDQDPSNDTQSFTFATADINQFRKEEGSTRGLIPNTAEGVFWEAGEVHSWEIGNAFYIVNGGFACQSIDFQANNPGGVTGEDVRIWLYKIEDVDQNGIIDKSDGSEITRIGLGEYTFTGFEDPTTLINIPIDAFSGNSADLELAANSHYVAAVEFPTQTVGVDFEIGASEASDYSAQIFGSQQVQTDPAKIRYSHIFGIGKEGTIRLTNTGDITSTNFGDDVVPVIRMNYVEVTSTVELSKDIAIDVFPSPAATQVTVDLELTQNVDKMNLEIMDVSGKVITSRSLNNVQNVREVFDVSNLTNGIYFMHVSSDLGIQTKRFVVSK